MAIFNNPYPVLSNSEGNFNNTSAEFNCTLTVVEFSNDDYSITIKSDLVNEPFIENLFRKGIVEFIVVVESKPFFRKVFKCDKKPDEIEIKIHYKEVPSNFTIDLHPKIITTQEFDYQNPNADYPMNEYAFKLSSKQPLATHKKITIEFDRVYKMFDTGPLISIIKLKDGENPQHGTMDIKLDDNFNIIVALSGSGYEKFKKVNQINPKLLSYSLGYPIIYHALTAIQSDPEFYKKYDWVQALDKEFSLLSKLESNEVDVDKLLEMTDTILDAPLLKLSDLYIKAED